MRSGCGRGKKSKEPAGRPSQLRASPSMLRINRRYGSAVSAWNEMRGLGRFEERSRVRCMARAICAAGYLGHRQDCLCYWTANASHLASAVREWRGSLSRAFGHGMPCPYCGKGERYWKAGSVERRNQVSRTMWRENHLVASRARPRELMRWGGRRRPIWTDQSSFRGPKRLVSNAR